MVTLFSKAFCLFTFENYAGALGALNQLTQDGDLEVLEAIQRGTFSSLIFLCSPETLKSLQPQLLALGTTEELILEKPHPELVKTYLNLLNQPIQESFLVFETNSLRSIFETLQVLLEKGWKSLEFRFTRSGSAQGCLLMTGPKDSLEKDFLAHLSVRGSVQLIKQPTEQFRRYFDL